MPGSAGVMPYNGDALNKAGGGTPAGYGGSVRAALWLLLFSGQLAL